MKLTAGLVLVCAMLGMWITGCATTEITTSWKDPTYHTRARKIMVVGIAKKTANVRTLEDEFVKQLKERGVDAVASYTVLPEGKEADDAVIAAKMKDYGADTVLITRLAGKETVYTFVQGYPNVPPIYYNTWRDYYGYGYQTIHLPGYIAEDEYASMETNVYAAGSANLIWTASSKTEILGSDQRFIKSYIAAMVKVMAQQHILE